MKDTSTDYIFKILTLGDSQVGKTSLLLRFTENKFVDNNIATIGIDVQVKTINYKGKKIELQLWDSAGQEKFRSLSRQFYSKAQGIILVYDITNKGSFTALKQWLKDIHTNFSNQPNMILVGNKTDLKSAVDKADVIEFTKELNIPLFLTSALTGEGIENAMNSFIEIMFEDIVKGKKKYSHSQVSGSFHIKQKKKIEKEPCNC